MLKVVLIRHGETPGNQKKRYIGSTDEKLCEKGIENLQKFKKEKGCPDINLLFVSPMKRCIETAEILYEKCAYQTIEDFRECDFGLFENQNYIELEGNKEYQRWIDSGGTISFPGGEDIHAFKKRCIEAFKKVMNESQKEEKSQTLSIGFVVHGGTIMSIMEGLCTDNKSYFDWQIPNGEIIVCNYVEGKLELC